MKAFFFHPQVRRNALPSAGLPVKVSRGASRTIDGLDLTTNCEVYALTAAPRKICGAAS